MFQAQLVKKVCMLVVAAALLSVGCGRGSGDPTGPGPAQLNTVDEVHAFLSGRVIIQEGADVPDFPNGADQRVICYSKVTLQFLPQRGVWSVLVLLGTPNVAAITCNQAAIATTIGPFLDSFAISNVKSGATCFDIDVFGAAHSGRASISADRKTVSWEIYQTSLNPSHHRCADGNLGSPGVLLNGVPFVAGRATQVWRVQN